MDVQHDTGKRRFFIDLDGGEQATLSYQSRGETLDIYSVFVPSSQRGKGVASLITSHALTYAREHDKKVVATCPYVSTYIARHSEYQDLLA